MISRDDLLKYYDDLLKCSQFEDYAPNGLQVEGKERVKKIAFAVSATLDSVEQALAWGADALIVHHGFFWKHQGARPIVGPWGKRVSLAVKQELNVIGYHLPLDAHAEVGNAATLAQALGLQNLAPFALYKKQPMGIKAELKTAMTAEAFQQLLSQTLGHPVIIATPDPKKLMKTVGIITGGANNEWIKAVEDKLDAYITGEISEYNWHDAKEAGLHYFAGGHHATERFGIKALMEKTLKDHSSVEVKFFDSANPA